jgi:two-component system, chemotaxis family, chemotaxis protein CheY
MAEPLRSPFKRVIQQAVKTFDENLLVVDDLPQMRDMMRVMLRNNRYTNLTFSESGNQALRIIGSLSINIVITDWNMPNMTGIELLKKIKSDAKLFLMPVLMISDESAADKVLYAVEEGVDGFLVKPFSEHDLIKNVKRTLLKSRSRDEMETKIAEIRRLKLTGNYREAVQLGEAILKVRNDPRVALMTCESLYHVEEYDKAIAMIADTDEENKTSKHSNLLGKIYMSLGQYTKGIISLEDAVKRNSLNNDQIIDLAGAYFATGQKGDAERVIDRILNSNPTDLNLVDIAQIYLDQGNIDKAGYYLGQTVDPIPATVPVFNNYAVALRRADRFEDAANIYLKCLRIDPESDVLHYNLALLYTKIDKRKEAKEALANALKLNPDNQYARELLEKLSVKKA